MQTENVSSANEGSLDESAREASRKSTMSKNHPVRVGDKAPDFTLPSASGKPVTLSDLYRERNVVLYFYPKDDTVGCTAESCAFRDAYEDFVAAGATVVGISSDSTASHARFAARHSLPFILLSDEGGRVRDLYGVRSTLGILPGRVTFVIDRRGVVRYAFSSQLRFTQHVTKALEVVRAIGAEEPPTSTG